MNYFIKYMILQMFIGGLFQIECNNEEIPSFELTNDPNTSYLILLRDQEEFNIYFAVPQPHGYWPNEMTTDRVKQDYLNRRDKNNPYKNVFRVRTKVVQKMASNQIDKHGLNLRLTVFDSKDNIRYMDIHYLDYNNDEYMCQFLIKLPIPKPNPQNEYILTRVLQNDQFLDIILQIKNPDSNDEQPKQMYYFKPSKSKGYLYAFMGFVETNQQTKTSIINEYEKESLENLNLLTKERGMYAQRRDIDGKLMQDNLYVGNEQNQNLTIPRWFIMNQQHVPIFEYFQLLYTRKFYQLEIPKQQQNEINEINNIVGFFVYIKQNKIQVTVSKNMQLQDQEVGFQQDAINIQEIKKIKIIYKYFQNDFPTTDIFNFEQELGFEGTGLKDMHFLVVPENQELSQQEQHQILITQQKKEDLLNVTIMFGPQSIIQKNREHSQQNQNLQISQKNSYYFVKQLQDDQDYLQGQITEPKVNFLMNKLFRIHRSLDGETINQYFEEQTIEQIQNIQQGNTQVNVLQQQYNYLLLDIEKSTLQIKNPENNEITRECIIPEHHKQKILEDLQQVNFKIIQGDEFEEDLEVELKTQYFGKNDNQIFYLFQGSDLADLNDDILKNSFCMIDINNEKVLLDFNMVNNGLVFVQSTNHNSSRKTIKFQQQFYILQDSQIIKQGNCEQSLRYDNIYDLDKIQHLMIDKFVDNKFVSQSKLFQNLIEQSDSIYYFMIKKEFIEKISQHASIENLIYSDDHTRQYILTQMRLFENEFEGQVYFAMLGLKKQIITFRYDYKKNNLTTIKEAKQQGKVNVIYVGDDKEENIFKDKYIYQIFTDYQQQEDRQRRKLLFQTQFTYDEDRKTFLYFYLKELEDQLYMFNVYGEQSNNTQMQLFKVSFIAKTHFSYKFEEIPDYAIFDTTSSSINLDSKYFEFVLMYLPIKGAIKKVNDYSFKNINIQKHRSYLIEFKKEYKISKDSKLSLEQEQKQDANQQKTTSFFLTLEQPVEKPKEDNKKMVIQLYYNTQLIQNFLLLNFDLICKQQLSLFINQKIILYQFFKNGIRCQLIKNYLKCLNIKKSDSKI